MLEKLSRFEKEQMRNAELREKMIVIFNEISVEMSRQISEKKANPHIQIGLNDKFRLVKVEEKYWIVPDKEDYSELCSKMLRMLNESGFTLVGSHETIGCCMKLQRNVSTTSKQEDFTVKVRSFCYYY